MGDCLFCRLVAGEIPARIVKRTDEMLAFHDIDAKAPVHVLVIPTRHVRAVRDATGPEGEALLGKLLAAGAGRFSTLPPDPDPPQPVTSRTARQSGPARLATRRMRTRAGY